MKPYEKAKRRDPKIDPKSSEKAPLPEDPFARMVYEWNNALLIAAQRMWDGSPAQNSNTCD